MQAGVTAQFKQQGHGMLGHITYPVSHHVAYGYAPLGQRFDIDDVISCSQYAYHTHTFKGGQIFLEQGGFVGEEHIRTPGALGQLILAGFVIYAYIAQSGDRPPINIAGVEHPAIQNDNLHENILA